MKLSRFAIYAWGVLAGNLLVVLWGAYVRATGSGAGCGAHWPLCNGTVVPRDASVQTMIEFTHRVTSGMALLAVVGLLVWALRSYPRGHRVRRAAGATMTLMVVEALLGAGLVLFELVAENTSMLRAFSMVAHLVNTFLLIGALAITAWWGSEAAPVRLPRQKGVVWLLGVGAVGMLVLGASGAIAALGDTLFPARSLAEGVRSDFSPTAHFLLRLRVLHPLIAVGTAVYLVVTTRLVLRLRPLGAARRLGRVVSTLVLVQLAAGTLNLVLLAPVWMQLVHLLLADLLWISFVLFGAAALAAHPSVRAPKDPEPRLAAVNR